MMVLGILIAAVPFVFAALRAAMTGTDFRYVWLALASTAMAALMLAVRARSMPEYRRIIRALLASTAGTYTTGFAVGAANAISIFVVALGFAVCSTAGIALIVRARAHRQLT